MRKRSPQRRTAKPQPLGPIMTYDVEGLTHEAKGVARLQGKVTFIEGALPGETVTAQVTKAGRRFDEAVLKDILEYSPDRIEPACSHFHQCGGCSFQHLTNEKQIASKADWLQGQLRHLITTQDLELLADVSIGYRRRARLSIHRKNGKTVLGYRGKASNDIVSIERCIVLTERLQNVFASLKNALLADDLAATLGHVELLEDTKGVSVVFRLTSPLVNELKDQWDDWAKAQDVIVYWQAPKSSKADVTLESMRYYDLKNKDFSDIRLKYHPQDFIQVNAAMNQKMVSQAMDWLNLNDQDVVLDLFCGVGNFSLPLAQRARTVIGVELQENMVDHARQNAEWNKIHNVSFIAADLTKPFQNELSNEQVNKVLLDPPRAGAFEFLDSIIKIGPIQILYVSCNASTLARDAEYLVAKGYRVLRVSLMDMFPQTSHVETMMLLQKKK